MISSKYKKGDQKLLNAWAIYDWANSAYPLVISSAVFPIYYGALFFDDLYIIIFIAGTNSNAPGTKRVS